MCSLQFCRHRVTTPSHRTLVCTSSHENAVNFRDLSRVVANNWKGLEPEIKVAYGNLAAFQQHLLEQQQQERQHEENSHPEWKNHVKVKKPRRGNVVEPIVVPIDAQEDEDIVEEVVEDILTNLEQEAQIKDKEASPPAQEIDDTNNPPPPPPFWPLQGPPCPIADYVRTVFYPQHVLEYNTTCLPCCNVVSPQPEFADLATTLDEDARDFCLYALTHSDDEKVY